MKLFQRLFKAKNSIVNVTAMLDPSKICLINVPRVKSVELVTSDTLMSKLKLKMATLDPSFDYNEFSRGALQVTLFRSGLL